MTVELALKAAAVLGGGFVAARALGAASAATRHATWRLTFVAVLLLPLVALLSPRWTFMDRTFAEPSAAWLQAAVGDAFTPGDRDRAGKDAQAAPAPAFASVGGPSLAPAGVMTLAWLIGAAGVSAFYLLGYLRLWHLRRRSRPAPMAWSSSAHRLAVKVGLPSPPTVRVTPLVPGPLVCGLVHTTLLIPRDAVGWPDARRDAVLIHELAHVRRRDVQAQLIAQAVCALHWFNPLAWMAARHLRREREFACDDAVLAAGVPPAWYARELLTIASEALGQRAPAPALSMARPSEMEGRLLAMLADRPRRMGLMARTAVPVLVFVSSIVVAGASTSAPSAVAADAAVEPTQPSPLWIVAPPGDEDRALVDERAAEATSASDAARRERATLALAFTAGDTVIPALLAALRDHDSHVREKAAIGLAWRRDPRIVPALLEALADADPHVREKALVALAFSGDARANDVIERARKDPDGHVRDKAMTLSRLR